MPLQAKGDKFSVVEKNARSVEKGVTGVGNGQELFHIQTPFVWQQWQRVIVVAGPGNWQ